MKESAKSLNIFLLIVLLITMSLTAIQMWELPENILKAVNVSGENALRKASDAALYAYISLFAMVTITLILLLSLTKNLLVNDAVKEDSISGGVDISNQSNVSEGTETQIHRESKVEQLVQSGESDLNIILSCLCEELDASVGVVYIPVEEDGKRVVRMVASFAYYIPESGSLEFEYGEGIIGQVAKSERGVFLENVPEGYIQVVSGLGQSSPKNLAAIPIFNETHEMVAVLELASFASMKQQRLNDLLRNFGNVFIKSEA